MAERDGAGRDGAGRRSRASTTGDRRSSVRIRVLQGWTAELWHASQSTTTRLVNVSKAGLAVVASGPGLVEIGAVILLDVVTPDGTVLVRDVECAVVDVTADPAGRRVGLRFLVSEDGPDLVRAIWRHADAQPPASRAV